MSSLLWKRDKPVHQPVRLEGSRSWPVLQPMTVPKTMLFTSFSAHSQCSCACVHGGGVLVAWSEDVPGKSPISSMEETIGAASFSPLCNRCRFVVGCWRSLGAGLFSGFPRLRRNRKQSSCWYSIGLQPSIPPSRDPLYLPFLDNVVTWQKMQRTNSFPLVHGEHTSLLVSTNIGEPLTSLHAIVGKLVKRQIRAGLAVR